MTLDVNGKNYSVTSQGQGNLNTVLGSLGAASFLGLGANGCGNGILGGMFGGNRCDNYVTEREQNLAIALAQAQSKDVAQSFSRDEDTKIFNEARRTDDKLAAVLEKTNTGLIEVATGLTRVDAKVACLEKDIAYMKETAQRNFVDSKAYTDMQVSHEAQLRKAGDDNIAAWTQTELNKKIDGTLKLDGGMVSWNGCRPVLQSCPCGSEQNPYFINSSTPDVTAITNAVLAAIKASQATA
jgi:hypothetical protein